MSNVPRASLCVTILDDEDYRILMTGNGGAEAFGVFVAMLVLGRERLQQGKARQMSETESLKFDNSTTHLLAMTHLTAKQLDKCLTTMEAVASDSNSQPWMYLDEDKQLVIRSFFKFNTKTGWGGARQGAGRNSSRIQDESQKNHLESRAESSRIVSGTGTGTGSTPTALPPADESPPPTIRIEDHPETLARNSAAETPVAPKVDPKDDLDYREAIGAVRTSLGESDAKQVGKDRVKIGKKIEGRWDCLAAAAGEVARRLARPGGDSIRTPFGLMVSIASGYVSDGGPPEAKTPQPTRRNYADGGTVNPTNRLIAPGREHLFDKLKENVG